MTKKVVSMVAALALVLSMGTGVYADKKLNGADSTTSTLDVSYTASESYTVTIPTTEVTLTADGQGQLNDTGELSAKDVILDAGHSLKITVNSPNEWQLKLSGDDGVKYELKYDKTGSLDGVANNKDPLLTVEEGTGSKTVNIKFALAEEAKATKSGKHTDKLTFTVTCGDDGE